ncbi:MAG: HAD-IA family hydrolase [Actinomycetota bacterium]|nr:HAD-IA family hydrolase [Actinomycetota bacterium]
MRFRTVLFDLDGTVIDSGPIIVASMRHAARTVLGRDVEQDVLTAAVGGPGLVAQMRLLDEERVDELVRVYREHNEPLHSELQACEGILDVLQDLKAEGRRLGIVTAKRRATVALAFEVLPDLEPLFDVVVGADETERHKPHPDPILHALEELRANADTAAYVGDSPFDVAAAKAAGVFAVAVTWGGIHGEPRLTAEHPDAIVDTAEELRGVL